jgi:hypothetical protein
MDWAESFTADEVAHAHFPALLCCIVFVYSASTWRKAASNAQGNYFVFTKYVRYAQ